MPVANYRIIWGGAVDQNALDLASTPIWVSVTGIAKPPKPEHHFEVINEIICADLGRGLCLPIPTGITATKEETGITHYVSFSVSLERERLPPANAEAIATDLPKIACGVILFDLWIGNADRSEKNLAYNEDTKTLHLIDHGRALFCGADWRGRLNSIDDEALIEGHCLTARLRSTEGFNAWSKRIKGMPVEYISDTVNGAMKIGLKKSEADFCTEFLLNRRKQLLKIIRKYKKKFYSVPKRTDEQQDMF